MEHAKGMHNQALMDKEAIMCHDKIENHSLRTMHYVTPKKMKMIEKAW
jgi:hypothetical protein